jgi:branched-chain amino acid transport system permease protein
MNALRERWAGIAAPATLVLVAAVVALLPHVLSGYRTYQFAQVGIYFIAVLGLNILTGYCGQISLGHGAFMLVGAYTTTSLVVHEGVRDLWTIPIAGVIAGVAGLLFGFPALRLAGVYLALATLALATAAPQLAQHFSGLTGGGTGTHLGEPRAPFGWDIRPNVWLYILSWSIAAVMFVLAWLLTRARFGRALRAVRDSPTAAVASGVNLALNKTLAFGVSAFFAGVSGSLLAISLGYINPNTFPITLSILLLTGAVVGGLGSLAGPIFGGLLIVFLWVTPFYSAHVGKDAPPVVYGLLTIAVMFVMPHGVVGAARRATAALTRARRTYGDRRRLTTV